MNEYIDALNLSSPDLVHIHRITERMMHTNHTDFDVKMIKIVELAILNIVRKQITKNLIPT